MFRAFFLFDTPAIVLVTEARLGFSSGNISVVGTFPGKERVPWERGCIVYTCPRVISAFKMAGGSVYSDSLVIL